MVIVQHIKITGIHAAIGFHNVLDMALSIHTAGGGDIFEKTVNHIIKKFNADAGAFFKVPYPPAQEAYIKICEVHGPQGVF
jgi:hypothetical protein